MIDPEIENRLRILEERSGKLDRNIDSITQKIIEDTIQDRLPTIWWDTIFYVTSVFESMDRYLIVGDATSTDAGLGISTSSGTCAAILQAKDNNPTRADRKTFFTTSVGIADVSEIIWNVGILDESTGFVIDAGDIKGYIYDGSTVYYVSLGTATDNTPYLLELVYYPDYKVDFFVDGELKGALTGNMIDSATVVSNIVAYGGDPKTGGSLPTSGETTHFTILQVRN